MTPEYIAVGLGAALAAMAGVFGFLLRRIVEKNDEAHRNQDRKFSDLESKVDHMDGAVTGLSAKVDSRVEATDQRFEQGQRRFDRLDGKVDKLGDRLGNVEKPLSEIVGYMKAERDRRREGSD